MSSADYITIPLTKGQEAIVSILDAEFSEVKWYAIHTRNRFYAARDIRVDGIRKTLYLHREILAKVIGRPLDSKEECDHKNGNTLLNTRNNLRLATHIENLRNVGIRKHNKSGYTGVSWHRVSQKWMVTINVMGKQIYLGLFDDKEEAYKIRCEAEKQYFEEFRRVK